MRYTTHILIAIENNRPLIKYCIIWGFLLVLLPCGNVGSCYGLSISKKNKFDIVFLLGYLKLKKFANLIYVSCKKDRFYQKIATELRKM